MVAAAIVACNCMVLVPVPTLLTEMVGCVLTALGFNFEFTLLGRIFQGIGHGILMPTCMAIMLYVFPIEKRGTILGFFGLLVGFAPVLGPTYSGIVVDNLG